MGLNMTLRATDIASARLRSISFKISFEGPRSRMVQALGERHSVRKVKYLQNGKPKKQKHALFDSLVTNFFNHEEATLCAHVGFPQVLHPINNGSSDS